VKLLCCILIVMWVYLLVHIAASQSKTYKTLQEIWISLQQNI